MNAFGRISLLLRAQNLLDKIQSACAGIRKDYPMLTVSQVLKSRTVWTLVLAAAFNGWNSISGQVPDAHVVDLVNGIFAVVALVFRIAPNQHVQDSSRS